MKPCSCNSPSSCNSLTEVFDRVEALSKRLRQFQSRTLKETGLTPSQYYILGLLSMQDGQPLKELATTLNCSRATMTGIIDTMEKKGLVQRILNRQDRRSFQVCLTGEGRDLLRASSELRTIFNTCCNGLNPEETQTLLQLLTKLSSSLSF